MSFLCVLCHMWLVITVISKSSLYLCLVLSCIFLSVDLYVVSMRLFSLGGICHYDAVKDTQNNFRHAKKCKFWKWRKFCSLISRFRLFCIFSRICPSIVTKTREDRPKTSFSWKYWFFWKNGILSLFTSNLLKNHHQYLFEITFSKMINLETFFLMQNVPKYSQMVTSNDE